MTPAGPLVCVVDDDESVRESLPELLHELGFRTCAFSSARELLTNSALAESRCLILDVAMPGMSGPDLQRELRKQGNSIPIIFITGSRNEDVRASVLAAGATDCLFKPFSDSVLLSAIRGALGEAV